MSACRLHRRIWLAAPLAEVFPFFADPNNLDRLTPPWLHFRIRTPPPMRMAAGTEIRYRLRLHGVPLRWRSEITEWDPPHSFVDVQRRGPYRHWIHRHAFRDQDGLTRVEDDVRYAVPGGWVVDRLLVRRDLGKIFDYRHRQLQRLFGEVPDAALPH